MKVIYRVLPPALVLATACHFLFAADTPPGRKKELSGVFVQGATNWYSVQELDTKARAYVNRLAKDFNPTSAGMSVWVYTQKANHILLVSYNSGMGKPFWNVYFGADGEVSKYESGVLSDGSGPPIAPNTSR
jgi:hypothetical protein